MWYPSKICWAVRNKAMKQKLFKNINYMNKAKDSKIILKYKNQFFDNYNTYIEVIEYINKSIPEYALNSGIYLENPPYYSYPEFCETFLKELRISENDNKDILDTDIIQEIFQKMISEKLDYSSSS